MNKTERYNNLYISIAEEVAEMSQAKRLHVGSVLVKDNNIIAYGWNGMPAGWDNDCENKEYADRSAGGWLDHEEIEQRWPNVDDNGRYSLVTKPEVLHAESNCLMKVAKSTNSSENSTMYVTHAPCIHCAKLIHQAGVKKVYYRNSYRDEVGIEFLQKCNITVEKI
jgi:dCMP deaminase